MKKLLILFLLIICSLSLFSKDRYQINQYMSIKNMSMGGTKITSSLDASALLYNPSLLRYLTKEEIGFFLETYMITNGDSMDLLNSMLDLTDDVDKVNEQNNLIKLLNAYLSGKTLTITENGEELTLNENQHNVSGDFLSLNFGTKTGYVKDKWGIGIFSDVQMRDIGVINRPKSPVISAKGTVTVEIPVGFNFKLKDLDNITFGGAMRYIYNAKINTRLDAADILDSINGDDDKISELLNNRIAYGFGLNLSAIYELPMFNVSFVIQDPFTTLQVDEFVEKEITVDGISSIEYSQEKLGKFKLPTNVSLGISNKPFVLARDEEGAEIRKESKIFWSAEMENIFSQNLEDDGIANNDFWKKLHVGGQYIAYDNKLATIKLRAGFNQGFLTWGLGARLTVVHFEYAHYTEELGPNLGMDKSSVHAINFGIKF